MGNHSDLWEFYLEELQAALSLYFILNNSTLNFQALDTFNTAVVSPIYYVMFTTLAIIASVIMFKVLLSDGVIPLCQVYSISSKLHCC